MRQELLDESITPEDRKELMELQYQIGRLELENMELEQHRIVHESILKGDYFFAFLLASFVFIPLCIIPLLPLIFTISLKAKILRFRS